MNLLFNEPQNYAWVLNYGRRLIEAESKDKEKNRTEHQINTRIYNNAFCGLLRTGYPFDIAANNNQVFITLMFDGIQFQCPTNTVSNILRQEYETIVRPKVDEYKQGEPKEQEKCEYEETVAKPDAEPDIKSGQAPSPENLEINYGNVSSEETVPYVVQVEMDHMSSNAPKEFQPQVILPVLNDITFPPVKYGSIIEIDEAEENLADDENAMGQVVAESKKEAGLEKAEIDIPDKLSQSTLLGATMTAGTEVKSTASVFDFYDLMKETPENNLDLALTAAVTTEPIAETPAYASAEVNPPSKSDYQIPESSAGIAKRMFQPKEQRFAPKNFGDSVSKTGSEALSAPVAPKEKKGFLSTLFSGGEKKKDDTESVLSLTTETAATAVQGGQGVKIADEDETAVYNKALRMPAVSYVADVEREMPSIAENQSVPFTNDRIESHNHDGGEIFIHVHNVTLKKQFGDSSAGPYRFIFWPLRIVEMHSKKTWADFLIHVTDQSGNEILLCTDGAYKELIVKVDGKEFNVYATWTNGIFESHISPYGKTASIYIIEDEVHKEEPEKAEHDSFLDQFRYERKGQPKHFIVPFKNNNRGELNIPIVGCVELSGKRYPLERREENTLRYRYHGSDKVIRGHWEKGMFKFSVDDANRFVWEEEHNE